MSLTRRWYLFLAALFLTAGACVGVTHLVSPTYQAKSSLVLIPPKDTQFPSTNRYLMLGNVGQASSVVIRALNGDETHQAVQAGLTGTEYEAGPDYTTNAPIVVITTSAATAASAQELLERVQAQVPQILTRLQNSVDIALSAQITAVPVTASQEPTKVIKKQIRAAGACGVGLAAILFMLIGAVDGFLVRRAQRSAGEDEEADQPRTPTLRSASGDGVTEADFPAVHLEEQADDESVAMFESVKRRGRR